MSYIKSKLANNTEELLSLLAREHCRPTLAYLAEGAEKAASVDELASHITEGNRAVAERVALRLHHATLPSLDDAGAVEYDPRSRTVRYREPADLEALRKEIEAVSSR